MTRREWGAVAFAPLAGVTLGPVPLVLVANVQTVGDWTDVPARVVVFGMGWLISGFGLMATVGRLFAWTKHLEQGETDEF